MRLIQQHPLTHVLILFAFLANTLMPVTSAYAEELLLPKPGTMVDLSVKFNPAVLKGIKVYPDNPFRFDFILDRGDSALSSEELQEESSRLTKYFLAALTIPEKDLWVNLSPYENDRIVPEGFGQTEMGRDLLAQDYLLKQITASLIYPEKELGQKFWQRVNEQAAAKFGMTNVPMNTFNKVWVVPEKAVVYENAAAGTAYIMESNLKVLLEEDYLALQRQEITDRRPETKNKTSKEGLESQQANAIGSQIVREIVIPELTKEVNEGKNFTKLRQVYQSYILAAWYKKKIKDSLLKQLYVDQNKVVGVNIDDPKEKEKIYEQYVEAFKKGVYNYIREEIEPLTQEITPRKYFPGGFQLTDQITIVSSGVVPILNPLVSGKYEEIRIKVNPVATTTSPTFYKGAPLPPALNEVSMGVSETDLSELLEKFSKTSTGRDLNDPKIKTSIEKRLNKDLEEINSSRKAEGKAAITISVKPTTDTFNVPADPDLSPYLDKAISIQGIVISFKTYEAGKEYEVARLKFNSDGEDLWMSGLFTRDISNLREYVLIIQNHINFDYSQAESVRAFEALKIFLENKLRPGLLEELLKANLKEEKYAGVLRDLIGENYDNVRDIFARLSNKGWQDSENSQLLRAALINNYGTVIPMAQDPNVEFNKLLNVKPELGGQNFRNTNVVLKILALAAVGLTKGQMEENEELTKAQDLNEVIQALRKPVRKYSPSQQYPADNTFQNILMGFSKVILQTAGQEWGYKRLKFQVAIPDNVGMIMFYTFIKIMPRNVDDPYVKMLLKEVIEERMKPKNDSTKKSMIELMWDFLRRYPLRHELATFTTDLSSNPVAQQAQQQQGEGPKKQQSAEMSTGQKMRQMVAGSSVADSVGGIDLIKMDLNVTNNGGEIKFDINPAVLKQLQDAAGFTPLVFDIQPMPDVSMFLGTKSSIKN